MSQLTVTDQTRVRRHRARIMTATPACAAGRGADSAIAFMLDGQVQRIPTACWREGETFVYSRLEWQPDDPRLARQGKMCAWR